MVGCVVGWLHNWWSGSLTVACCSIACVLLAIFVISIAIAIAVVVAVAVIVILLLTWQLFLLSQQ